MDWNHGRSKIAIFLLLIVVIAGLAGCGHELLKSTWLKSTSVVQGEPDWWNLPAFPKPDLNGSFTLINDSTDLYLRFYSKDHRLAGRIKRAGLTVWLSNQNDKNAKIGIEFPIGMHAGGGGFHPDRFLPQGEIPATEIDEMLKLQSDDIHILSNMAQDSGRKTPEQAAQMGINVQLNSNENSVEYILKLSMDRMPDWIRPGNQIGVRIYSPALEHPRRQDREDHEEAARGGMPPMGGDIPGNGRGNRGGHGGERPEGRRDADHRMESNQAIDYQFMLQLALPPTP